MSDPVVNAGNYVFKGNFFFTSMYVPSTEKEKILKAFALYQEQATSLLEGPYEQRTGGEKQIPLTAPDGEVLGMMNLFIAPIWGPKGDL